MERDEVFTQMFAALIAEGALHKTVDRELDLISNARDYSYVIRNPRSYSRRCINTRDITAIANDLTETVMTEFCRRDNERLKKTLNRQ